jgi:hypothetical protein
VTEHDIESHEQSMSLSTTPLWVIKECRRSMWLYDYFRALGDPTTTTRAIADDFHISVETVRRAANSLVAAGALEINPRYDIDGAQLANQYVTRFTEPEAS